MDSDVLQISRIPAVPRILETVAHITGLRFAAVARVTDTSWTACATYDELGFGLVAGGQLDLATTICNEIRQSHEPVIFDHASLHPVFSKHHTPRIYGLESYVSVPIFRADGSFFGTLCAIDSAPAKFDGVHILRSMELFAELIGTYLESEDRLHRSQHDLKEALNTGELREQFIAVLGHDLRSPLQAAILGAELLASEPVSERGRQRLGLVLTSLHRIDGLVSDVLDFARGRLGGGIPAALDEDTELEMAILQIVDEVRTISGRADLEAIVAIDGPILCDRKRIIQMLANLLGNAATHGSRDRPIALTVRGSCGQLSVSVRNGGTIPREKITKLFQPFSRTLGDEPRPGLGLGLYIASEIAKAHGGTLSVVSSDSGETEFTFRM